MIDIHSHILPGLDDGSRSMEQTFSMLWIASAEGIHTIIATPHSYGHRKSASVAAIQVCDLPSKKPENKRARNENTNCRHEKHSVVGK